MSFRHLGKKKKKSITYLADQGPLAHLPWEIATLSSSYELTSTILLQKKSSLSVGAYVSVYVCQIT